LSTEVRSSVATCRRRHPANMKSGSASMSLGFRRRREAPVSAVAGAGSRSGQHRRACPPGRSSITRSSGAQHEAALPAPRGSGLRCRCVAASALVVDLFSLVPAVLLLVLRAALRGAPLGGL
jgi:hypothetical protein